MPERTMKFAGKPVTLFGQALRVGDHAPEFQVVGTDLQERHLHSTAGKVRVISVVPSVDTSVCSIQSRRFEEEAARLPDGVVVLTVSMDLPFAQKRWQSEQQGGAVTMLSDHRHASFGRAYGTLIEDLRLLSRAAFVVDAHDVVRYAEYVPDAAVLPDFDKVLAAATEALQ